MNKIKENMGGAKRIVGLDIFRFLLALLIFLFHSNIHIQCSYSFLTPFISMGAVAMTGFFILSGYSLYLSNGKTDLDDIGAIKKFYLKRFISVYPVYYLTAIMYITMMCMIGCKESFIQHMLITPIDILGLQSIFTGSFSFSHHGGTWFISCISICYLIYPYLQLIINQLTEKTKFLLIILLIFLLLLSPLVQIKMNWSSIYANPLFRLMEFMIGILLAKLNYESQNKYINVLRTEYSLIIGSIGLFVGVTLAVKLQIAIGNYMLYSWVALPAFIMIILSISNISINIKSKDNIIKYLSAISYVFFMAQFFVWNSCLYLCQLVGYDSNTFRIITSITLCTIIAIAMHECFEKPITKYLKGKIIQK